MKKMILRFAIVGCSDVVVCLLDDISGSVRMVRIIKASSSFQEAVEAEKEVVQQTTTKKEPRKSQLALQKIGIVKGAQ